MKKTGSFIIAMSVFFGVGEDHVNDIALSYREKDEEFSRQTERSAGLIARRNFHEPAIADC